MKIKSKWDKTKLVSHFGKAMSRREKRRREDKRRSKGRSGKVWNTMGLYGILWVCIETICVLYGFLYFIYRV